MPHEVALASRSKFRYLAQQRLSEGATSGWGERAISLVVQRYWAHRTRALFNTLSTKEYASRTLRNALVRK